MNLGSAIEQCRILKGFTKSKLAEESDLSVSYLSLIVKGDREPTFSSLEKIASALDIPSSLLVFLAAEDEEIESISEDLRDELRRITVQLVQKSDNGTAPQV